MIVIKRYERVVAIYMSLLLIMLNLGSLYFVVDLMSYDEIVGYLTDGGMKHSDTRHFISVLLTTLFNILFVFTVLCSWVTRK